MTLDRKDRLAILGSEKQWDVAVIGGGASGLGAAVEAASRGLRTVLLERTDFAQGTSSRSTKLAHGGVRYLEQMNIALVLDALKERGYMLRNAPHLVHKLDFVVPLYSYAAVPYYGVGLKLYEWLSGSLSLGPSKILSSTETVDRLATVTRDGLVRGVLYRDGQFDDARYAIALMRTLEDLGGLGLNYANVTSLIKRNGRVEGVRVREEETGEEFDLIARIVINATGAFAENVLSTDSSNQLSLALSQGSHFVLPKDVLPGTSALMVPRTSDGRVLFAIPWHGHVLIGTTDEPVSHASSNPVAMPIERQFLAEHIRKYLGRSITSKDVISVWSGLRPLVRKGNAATSKLSRDHQVVRSPSGLISVTGGKWTTYRKMGEDTISLAIKAAGLKAAASRTVDLHLHGWQDTAAAGTSEWERVYGSDFPQLAALSAHNSDLDALLHPLLPYRKREIIWAARYEQARTTEDILARRTRALFLNARASIEMAPEVSRLLAVELNRNESYRTQDLANFNRVASSYIYED